MSGQLIVVLVACIFLVLFTFQNPHPVQMQFMGLGAKEFPIIAVILVATLVGVIVSTILSLKGTAQLKRTIRGLKKEVDLYRNPPPVVESKAVKTIEAEEEDSLI